jgi:nitrogen fixation protein FixH
VTVTLFGGAALIALLYFGLRLAGISNYWRGVISGALPTLGIMFYSLSHWPGADVVALHLALYVATAIVLTLTGDRKIGQPRQPLHWIPKIIIGFFLTLALMMAAFVSISISGLPPSIAQWFMPNAGDKPIYTAFSGEVPHDETAAKMIASHMKKSVLQRQLGWQIEVAGLDRFEPGQAGEVTVSASDSAKQPIEGAAVTLTIKRPADGADTGKPFNLSAFAPGRYRAQITMDRPGQWVAVLLVVHGQDRFETAKEIIVPAP